MEGETIQWPKENEHRTNNNLQNTTQKYEHNMLVIRYRYIGNILTTMTKLLKSLKKHGIWVIAIVNLEVNLSIASYIYTVSVYQNVISNNKISWVWCTTV